MKIRIWPGAGQKEQVKLISRETGRRLWAAVACGAEGALERAADLRRYAEGPWGHAKERSVSVSVLRGL